MGKQRVDLNNIRRQVSQIYTSPKIFPEGENMYAFSNNEDIDGVLYYILLKLNEGIDEEC